MNEYKKKLAAQQQGQLNKESASAEAPEMTNGIPNSVLTEVFAGRRKATGDMVGHRVNLAESINAKMTQAFGMDVSQLRVYRSKAMSGTGMKGISQGNTVVLSEDVDLNTTEGQAVLGHELSHIHAQSQGVGMGHSGLYKNAGLEHQADVEGMRAARGRPIYFSGMEYSDGMKYGLGMKGVEGLAPMSPGLGATAAAPMQAWKDDDQEGSTGLLEPEKKPKSSFGSSLKKKFSSFTPTGRRQLLNKKLTQELAAFGMTVTDEPLESEPMTPVKSTKTTGQQNPQSPVLGKQPLMNFPQPGGMLQNPQGPVLGKQPPMNFPLPGGMLQKQPPVKQPPVNQQPINQPNGEIAKQLQDSSVVANADLKDFDPKFAKEVNVAFSDAKKDFPELKMNFFGTIQDQLAGVRQMIADEYEKKLRATKNGSILPDEFYQQAANEYADKIMKEQNFDFSDETGGWALNYLKGPYAKYNGIAINKKSASDNDEFNKNVKYNVETKFHPEGCTTSKSVIDHELGHQIDHLVNGCNDNYIQTLYAKFMKEPKPEEKLSKYAEKNIKEFIAEGYAEYRNNPNPREYAQNIYKRLMELYGQREQKKGQKGKK